MLMQPISDSRFPIIVGAERSQGGSREPGVLIGRPVEGISVCHVVVADPVGGILALGYGWPRAVVRRDEIHSAAVAAEPARSGSGHIEVCGPIRVLDPDGAID